jgi:hypothetical protein
MRLGGPQGRSGQRAGTAYRSLWWMIYQFSWNTRLFINDNTCGHAWWGTTSFSPHFQTLQDFRWTLDRAQRPSRLAWKTFWPQSSQFLAVGDTPKDFGVLRADQLEIFSNDQRTPVMRIKWNQEFSTVWRRTESRIEIHGIYREYLL